MVGKNSTNANAKENIILNPEEKIMEILKKEVKIELAVLVSAVILVIGIEYLTGVNLMKPTNYYYIEYKNVTGLTVSTPVLIDGFKVGLVREITYNYDKPGTVTVEVSLDNQLKVPSGSKAVLLVDFLGTATIDLQLNKYVSTYHSAGDVLIGENAPDMLGSIQKNVLPQLEVMLPKIDTILTGIQTIVTNPALTESLENLNRITAELETSSKRLNSVMSKDIPPILANVTDITKNVSEFSSQLNELELKKTVATADSTLSGLKGITDKFNDKDNTLGLLLNDKQLYDGLLNTVGSADSLLIDLRLNPKRYVHFSLFGRKK